MSWGKPPLQETNLSILNCCRNVDQNHNGKSNPLVTMLMLTSLQRIYAGENLEENESPTLYVGGKKLAIVSAMDTLRIPETNFSRGTNARTWHPHTWAYIPRNSSLKRNLHPDQD